MEKSASGRRTVMLTATWGVALFGVLQLYRIPADAAHSICGPWGCGPPIQALAACHGFWLVLFSLPTGLICDRIDPRTLRRIGLLLVLLGIAGLAGIAVWEAVHWWPRAGEFQRQYIVQRYLFVVATLIDIPVVEVSLAGLACYVTARRRTRQPAQTLDAPGQPLSAPEPLATSEPHCESTDPQPAQTCETAPSRSDA